MSMHGRGAPVELTVEGQPREPGGGRLIFTLGLAAMIAGFILAGAYELTRPTIEANRARALRRAVFEVVPGSTRMRRLVLRDGHLVAADEQTGPREPSVYAAYDQQGRFLGYAIEGEGPGFQDTIALLFGYDPVRKRVTGMFVLESRETPGLGDRIYKDERFVANFRDLAVEPQVRLVKGGRKAPNEVDAITGATISSRAVVNIVNAALQRWLPVLPPPEQVPPAPPAGAAAASQEAQDG